MQTGHRIACLVALLAATMVLAESPATRPAADPILDWLLEQSTTAPATQPATMDSAAPQSPLVDTRRSDARNGTIVLSNGTRITGPVRTTEGKPLRIWDDEKKEYRDVPFRLVRTIDGEVLWDDYQPEYHFPESGSDIKEFTGRTYPVREVIFTVTLINGEQVFGSIVAPLYVEDETGKQRTIVLSKRQKGEAGQKLADVPYVRRVELGE
jgi:hypothetical protein